MDNLFIRHTLTADIAADGCGEDSTVVGQPCNISFPSIKEERLENCVRDNTGNLPQAACSTGDGMTGRSPKLEPGRIQMDNSFINHTLTADIAADASVLGSGEDSTALGQPFKIPFPSTTTIPIKEEPLENGVRDNAGILPQVACSTGDGMTGRSPKLEPGSNMPDTLLCAGFTKSICMKKEWNFPEKVQRELVLSVKVEEEEEEVVEVTTCEPHISATRASVDCVSFSHPQLCTLPGHLPPDVADNSIVHHTIDGAKTSQSNMCSENSESALDPNATASDASSLLRTMELPEEFFMSDNEVELLDSDEALLEMMHDLCICPVCNRTFQYPSRLRKHMIAHSTERKFKCDKCGDTLKNKDSLKTHLLTHSFDKPFSCDMCFSSHCTKSALIRHIETKHGTGERRFICDICGLLFLYKSGLDRHLLHHRDKKVLCVACGRLFYTEQLLKTHVNLCHDPLRKKPKNKYECSHCGCIYATKFMLKVHILTVHLKELPFTCVVCGHKCAVKDVMEKHMLRHNERKFKCNCGKSFSTRVGLERHSLTHVNHRPYVCDMCGLTFTQKSSVERHIVLNMRGHFKRTGTCKPVRNGRGGFYVSNR